MEKIIFVILFITLSMASFIPSCSMEEDEGPALDLTENYNQAPDFCLLGTLQNSEEGGFMLRIRASGYSDSLLSAQVVLNWTDKTSKVTGFWANEKIRQESDSLSYNTEAGKFYYSFYPGSPTQSQGGKIKFNTFELEEEERIIDIAFDKDPGQIWVPMNPNGKPETEFGYIHPIYLFGSFQTEFCQ